MNTHTVQESTGEYMWNKIFSAGISFCVWNGNVRFFLGGRCAHQKLWPFLSACTLAAAGSAEEERDQIRCECGFSTQYISFRALSVHIMRRFECCEWVRVMSTEYFTRACHFNHARNEKGMNIRNMHLSLRWQGECASAAYLHDTMNLLSPLHFSI